MRSSVSAARHSDNDIHVICTFFLFTTNSLNPIVHCQQNCIKINPVMYRICFINLMTSETKEFAQYFVF